MESLINILLVDDNVEDHIFFREAINKINVIGHNVVSVYDGMQALDFLYKRGNYKNSKEVLPDLIILDLEMPVMDGYTFIKTFKSDFDIGNTPVYVLTGSGSITDMNSCRELGCAGFFTKQSKNDKLTNIIARILEKEASRI